MSLQSYDDFYDFDPTTICRKCEDSESEKDSYREYLEEIVQQIYGVIPLDKGNLEHCLDELCSFFDVKQILNAQGPMIERSNHEIYNVAKMQP